MVSFIHTQKTTHRDRNYGVTTHQAYAQVEETRYKMSKRMISERLFLCCFYPPRSMGRYGALVNS